MNLLGALPARFRRERVLLVGCGDVGLRVARELGLGRRCRLFALTSSPARVEPLRQQGITPLLGNLDEAATLRRLAGVAHRLVHLAPPASDRTDCWQDLRSAALWRALATRTPLRRWVYASTTGVYGDRQGNWVDETAPVSPQTPRAHRRHHAEQMAKAYSRQMRSVGVILRIPGIYAPDRATGHPRERLSKGSPVLEASGDIYTNHIHADDLARACALALWRGADHRVVHVVDNSELKMGDYFDWLADHFGLPRPPRVTREQARERLSPMALSFMNESRRLHNQRLKTLLRLVLCYPTVQAGWTNPALR